MTGKIRREGSQGSFLSLPKSKFRIAFLLHAEGEIMASITMFEEKRKKRLKQQKGREG